MKRYQVYLDPSSVSILDDFEKESKITRSKIIREAVDRIAQQYVSTVPIKSKRRKYVLDSLAGSISIKGKKRTNYAEHVDDIYLQD